MRDRYLWVGCALYTVVFTLLGAQKYAVHRNLVDFGIFEQTVASAFGCFCNPLEGSHWAFHFSPILFAVGGAVGFAHSPITLVALQALAGALCAPPVYALVRARSDAGTARLAATAVWLYPPLAGLTFGDFHENGFAPAAVVWALYGFDTGRFRTAAVAVLAAVAVKEDQACFLAFAGVAGAIAYRSDPFRRNFALGVAAVSAVVALAFFGWIQPHADANPHWQPSRFYAWTSVDAAALLPRGILERFGFLLLVFVPLAFLPLRTAAIVVAVPPLVEVLASRMSTTYTLGSHYAGAWIGYVLYAFAAGAAGVGNAAVRRRAVGWALALCVLELVVADPLHPGINLRLRQPRDAALDTALAGLPRDASVATQEEAYTHLALDDPSATLLPERASTPLRACFALIDRAFPDSPRLVEYGGALQSLVSDGRYALVARRGGIEFYRSVNGCP
ncbi:MAG TPA: DUF2079 domain-containing protein [Candidatus Acidoferrales bacterium]|nr:DUF2079 domain-containing protein [Candidatus Acidoferrales bacterium]